MKYTVVQTAQFVRDVRRLRRRGLEISKLENREITLELIRTGTHRDVGFEK